CCSFSPGTTAMQGSASPSPSRPRSTFSEPRQQLAHGASAVADGVLLAVLELRHRPLCRLAVGQERWVIAEAAVAARLPREATAAASVKDTRDAARGIDVRERAYVRQSAAGGRLAQ